MSERYTKIFSLPSQEADPNLDIPVQIEAGALLKDNKSQMIIAQVKYRNISAKSIKEMAVGIKAFDAMGDAIEGTQGFLYRKLSVGAGEFFGDRVAVPMADNNASSFFVEIVKVIFSDGSIWDRNVELALETAKNAGDETVKVAKNFFDIIRKPSKKNIETALLVGNCIFTLVMFFFIGKYIGHGFKKIQNTIGFIASVLIMIITLPGLGKVIFKKSGYGLFQRYLRWASALAVFFIAQIIIGICLIIGNPAVEKPAKKAEVASEEKVDTVVDKIEDDKEEIQKTEAEYMVCTVSEMLDLLDSNAMKAEAVYQDKNVEITGKLDVIDSDGKYISLCPLDDEWAIINIICYLQNDGQKQQVMEMQKDDIVTLRGKITSIGELIGYELDIDSIH